MGETTWSHQNKEWQKTLDLARSYGWDPPVKLNAHGGLRLNCPQSDPRHSVRVFSTGGDTETVAIDFRKKIRNCPHRDLSEPLTRIQGLLDGAERMLDAGDALLDAAAAESRMEALLDDLDVARAQLDSVGSEFDDAADEAERARASVEPSMRDLSLSDLAEGARSDLRGSDLALRDDLPKQHETWQELRERHNSLSERLAGVRRRAAGQARPSGEG